MNNHIYKALNNQHSRPAFGKPVVNTEKQHHESPSLKGPGLSIVPPLGEIDSSRPLKNQTPEGFKTSDPSVITLCQEINQELEDNRISLFVNEEAVERICNTSFWSGAKSKVFCMNSAGDLTQYKDTDIDLVINKINGGIVDIDSLKDRAEFLAISEGKLNRGEYNRLLAVANDCLFDFIKMNRQRENVEMCVDMFTEKAHVIMADEKVKLVYPHVRLEVDHSLINEEMITGYKKHFPELDETIDHIVNSRFASDRKKCYHWMHCTSDWGKGFFSSALESLGVIVNMNATELKKAMEGGPVGKTQADFKRAMVVQFNEFKKVTSDMKSIENSITISPKNQLSVKVDIFLKIFSSAEHIPSLAGETGVENQFANRFTYFKGEGCLNSLLDVHGKHVSFLAVKNYIANRLNDKIDEMLSLGESAAYDRADKAVSKFHFENGITNTYESMDLNMGDLVESIREWLCSVHMGKVQASAETKASIDTQKSKDDFIFLKSVSKVVDDYIRGNFTGSEAGQVRHKVNNIRDLLSFDSEPMKNRSTSNYKNMKCIAIQVDPELIRGHMLLERKGSMSDFSSNQAVR